MPLVLKAVPREFIPPITGGFDLVDENGEKIFYVNFIGYRTSLNSAFNQTLCNAFKDVIVELPEPSDNSG